MVEIIQIFTNFDLGPKQLNQFLSFIALQETKHFPTGHGISSILLSQTHWQTSHMLLSMIAP